MIRQTDIAIIGGGLAGLTLALQLKKTIPDINVSVFEKSKFPFPKRIHKVGESMVEISSWYLSEVLGLRDYLLECHLPKFGLRFFIKDRESQDISIRPEYGLMDIPEVPASINSPIPGVHLTTFNVDRGLLENHLYQLCLNEGVEVYDNTDITSIDIGKPHRVKVCNDMSSTEFQSQWIIDCGGWAGKIVHQLNLRKYYSHHTNAVWFRLDGRIDPDRFTDSQKFLDRTNSSMRWMSTNHFMGNGYWVWLIPLPDNATSVGIMADPTVHDVNKFKEYKLTMQWLRKEEPVLADAVSACRPLDFHSNQVQSFFTTQSFSSEKWAISGESGFFTDALYSPGGDFIAVGNTLITEMIQADFNSDRIRMAAMMKFGDQFLKDLFDHYTGIYRDAYKFMGSPGTMLQKVAWDTAVYFGYNVTLFRNNRLCDPFFHKRISSESKKLKKLQKQMIGYFRNYKHSERSLDEHFIDQAKVRSVQSLYLSTEHPLTDLELEEQLRSNMEELEYFSRNIEKQLV
ncbi:MAG: hypothetical protein HKN92_03990 [Chitinophagales bacterium]|nr:hypothetical protein [Chitinophagales bacterium]